MSIRVRFAALNYIKLLIKTQQQNSFKVKKKETKVTCRVFVINILQLSYSTRVPFTFFFFFFFFNSRFQK